MFTDQSRDLRGHRIAESTLLVLGGIFIALMIGEAAVRLSGLGRPEFYTHSQSQGWKLSPGASGWQTEEGHAFVRINRWGYRGPDWQRDKPAGTVRIAVLGDSFIEAQQVPEQMTACALIASALNAQLAEFAHGRYRTIKRVEVMNFGVDGYGTAQELFTLTRDVWQFSPDIVVLAFFPGNDVRNNSAVLEGDKCRPFFVPRNGGLALGGPFEDSAMFRLRCFMRFASYNSQLLNTLGRARSTIRSMMRQHSASSIPRKSLIRPGGLPAAASLSEPSINDLIYRAPINQTWAEAWQVSEAEIMMAARDTRAHHADFLVVIVDTGVQTMPDALAQERYIRVVGATDLLYPSHRIEALGMHDRFPVLDLAQPMKSYAQSKNVYFHGFANTRMGSGHWNECGNRFAASIIADKLIKIIDSDEDVTAPDGVLPARPD
jgi:hypothetical protein